MTETTTDGAMVTKTTRRCSVDGCVKSAIARGWCSMHYYRWHRSGSTEDGRPTEEERFWPRVDKSGECWIWTGGCTSLGYGAFQFDGKQGLAHRFAYRLAYGDVPAGLVIDHKCRTRNCVRPDHLHAVTMAQNLENQSRHGHAGNSSGVRGVSWVPGSGKWVVQVNHNKVRHYGGMFTNLADAARAAVDLRNSLHTNNLQDRISA